MGDAQSAANNAAVEKKRWMGRPPRLARPALSALTRLQGGFKTIRLTAPSTPGTSSYWACVDSVADESDATNNCFGEGGRSPWTNNLATGAPTITGTAQVSQTLTASTSDISDSDGLDNVSYDYQWLADDSEIDGATSSTYTIQASDNGKVIKVQVTFTDGRRQRGDADQRGGQARWPVRNPRSRPISPGISPPRRPTTR